MPDKERQDRLAVKDQPRTVHVRELRNPLGVRRLVTVFEIREDKVPSSSAVSEPGLRARFTAQLADLDGR